ncbi:phycobilisome protein [Leptolyngbya ohadii]|uniref:phycobilisome protein n=1 Tax=Leptolyngbya ohadii TaxID=1962290 RepID=UPI000B598D9D|nr:phycobilisome protein [Leptolyngbya ohadii]
MLRQLNCLSRDVEGRYATDAELQFIADYVGSFAQRLQTYQKLQDTETAIVQQTYAKVRTIDSRLFMYGSEDATQKWKRDTLRTLRYTAAAVLLNDSETLQERFLLWFQTIMRAFSVQRSCEVTYQAMQDVVRQQFPVQQANLICPILELNRRSLGNVT